MKLSALVFLLPFSGLASACACAHNNDAARWEDSLKPSDRIQALCNAGGGCHDATNGHMCVTGDTAECGCAIEAANAWQTWNVDWWLWSAITCGDLTITIT